MQPRLTSALAALALGAALAAPAAAQVAAPNASVTYFTGPSSGAASVRPTFTAAAAANGQPATNVIDFQAPAFGPYGPATGSDFIPTFTQLGFVRFNTNSNFRQEVIDGFNVGAPNNQVYTTLAGDKTLPLADVTFGRGVFSLGFDFKDTAGNGSAGALPQTFTFALFSGLTSLGSFSSATLPPGNVFSFAGFTSAVPITELIVTSLNFSPNQDVVLDNFALSDQVGADVTATPEPATLALLGAGLLATAVAVRRRRRPA